MKFLVDAQLPRRFANWLKEAGRDALHTLDLPGKNHTPDSELVTRAMQGGRIVISKDADFVQSFLITGEPRLLLISTGNISNAELGKSCAPTWAGSSRFSHPADSLRSPAMHWWCMNENNCDADPV